MYTRQEASQLRQQFWTAFGQYMAPILSADGEKVNWVNYKTGIRGITFRMDASVEQATITIEISGSQQHLYFQQFQHMKAMLQNTLGEDWQWQLQVPDEHEHIVSRISITQQGINIFKKEDWPQFISFFKPRIIALDEFWSTARYVFEAL